MESQFDRNILIIEEEKQEIIKNSHVAIFGVGGVGGFAIEALARSGVGEITIIDKDTVDITNLNRQIIALHSTIGKDKVVIMKERIKDINPNCKINDIKEFFLPETSYKFDFTKFDYVVDAIDTVTAKIELITKAKSSKVPIISSMGAGNRMDPTMFQVADIHETSICPLAKVMRKELKKRNIKNVKVVYTKEIPVKNPVVGSISFVPSTAGMILASQVIRDLIDW